MILGVDELLKLVSEKKLVEGLSERELTNPEGCGFDLRLGKVWEISGETFLGITDRKSVEAKLVMEYDETESRVFELKPGQQVLVTIIEKINLPDYLTVNFWLRSTLYRGGVILSGGNGAPGYSGEISFTLFNSGECTVKIEMGARIVHMMFYEVRGKTNLYRGQWQGGRVVTEKKETQV
ncbi:MAG: hypothetical protein PHR98_00130 [Candidatus Shapirobacteria bacterium]|jgi:deoxycytidine triphosphate deaminase|nr:hypothetical protein [Candidatus Shapirobacteria bacterium]